MQRFVNTTGFVLYVLLPTSEYFLTNDTSKIKDSEIFAILPSIENTIYPIEKGCYQLDKKSTFVLFESINLPDPANNTIVIVAEEFAPFLGGLGRRDIVYGRNPIYYDGDFVFTELIKVC